MICVDANILVAALDSQDLFHEAASEAIVGHRKVIALNVTCAEALVHPYRVGRSDEARLILEEYGVETVAVTNAIAYKAADLRATHGNRNFPMLDALVVATGIESGASVVTTDSKWPSIPNVDIQLLGK